MFGIGFAEILVIMIVALLVFGPDRLPEMTKQAASFVRDLRKMVSNARRDISLSAQDLGIDEEDLRTLRQLRNPKAFVRDKVLDGIDLEDLGIEEPETSAKGNGGSKKPDPAGRPRGGPAAAPDDSKPEPGLSYDPDTT
ncbi:MAG TPA: Sec-independent protein translocase protein TatB [Jiangellaceae bacterium]|nr:Sec-independent protein translocase protein TatB [Jiangellaceae bacterium]